MRFKVQQISRIPSKIYKEKIFRKNIINVIRKVKIKDLTISYIKDNLWK